VYAAGARGGRIERDEADMESIVSNDFWERDGIRPAANRRLPRKRPPHAVPVLRSCARRRPGARASRRPRKVRPQDEAGEILGVAGWSGMRSEGAGGLILACVPLAGEQVVSAGGRVVMEPFARMRQGGVAFIPEDPLAMVGLPGDGVRENLALARDGGTGKAVKVDVAHSSSAHDGVLPRSPVFGSSGSPRFGYEPPVALDRAPE